MINLLYDFVESQHKYFYSITRYALNNYTHENYRKWKKFIVLGISVYFICVLLIFEVTSGLLINYICQFILSYFIIDQIEHKKFRKFINHLFTYKIHITM